MCSLYFQCQDTFVQFGSFLSMQLSTEEFVKRLPAIDTLVSTYHVPPDAAFFLSRSRYSYAINVSNRFLTLAKVSLLFIYTQVKNIHIGNSKNDCVLKSLMVLPELSPLILQALLFILWIFQNQQFLSVST